MNKKTRNQLIIGGGALLGAYFLYQRVLKPKSSASSDSTKMYEEDPIAGGIGGGIGGGGGAIPTGSGGFPTGGVGVGLGVPSYGADYVVIEEESTTKECWSGCPNNNKITVVGDTCPSDYPYANSVTCSYEETTEVSSSTDLPETDLQGGTDIDLPSQTCWTDSCPSTSLETIATDCPSSHPLSSQKSCPIVPLPNPQRANLISNTEAKASFSGTNGQAKCFDGEDDYAEVFLTDDADLNANFGEF
jgi:hypothetical protein